MKIAVLGMGRMGQALAGRLLDAEHQLVIWNRTPGKAPSLVERGAREAKTIAAAVEGVDAALTSLANDDAVRAVALGGDGVRASLPQGAVYVDASTVSPGLSSQLDDEFPRFVAMPVLGSPAAVQSGQATFLLGGAQAALDAVESLIPALGGTVRRYGTPAEALTAKLSVNLLLLDGVVALAESIAVGRAGGLSDEQLSELLRDSPMVPPGIKNRFEAVLVGPREGWWSAALGAKDASLAVDLVEGGGGRLPVTATVRDLYRAAATELNAEDISAVAELYQRRS